MYRSLLALVAYALALPAFAADYTDLAVPGTAQYSVVGQFSDQITIEVVNQAGHTDTQATIMVDGSFQCFTTRQGCSFRQVSITGASLTNPDGTPALDSAGNPITMTDHPVRNSYGYYVDYWLPSDSVPVGTYILSVSGVEDAFWRANHYPYPWTYPVIVNETQQ